MNDLISEIPQFLQKISSHVDMNNKKQKNLYEFLQLHSDESQTLQKFIKLLLSIILESNTNSTINRLLSYLKSHVSLLQAITQNPDLASLFLIGENGNQSFTNLQKSILSEQAARTRKFISDFNVNVNNTSIGDFKSYFTNPEDMPNKIDELNQLKEEIKNSKNLIETKNAFEEVCSTLETVFLFNDLLLRKFTLLNKQTKSKDSQKNKNIYEKEIKSLHEQIDLLKEQLKQDFYSDDSSEYQKNEKVTKSKKTVQHLNSNANEMIRFLQNKLDHIQNENKEMREALEKANLNYININDELKRQSLETISQNKALKKENTLLINQVQHLQEQINNYQKQNSENEIIISKIMKKLNKEKSNSLILLQNQTQQNNKIEDLKQLLKKTEQRLNDSNVNYLDSNNQLKEIQKQYNRTKEENLELKEMLQQSSQDTEKAMKEKALLIRQLNRNGIPKETDPKLERKIIKLKQKLKSALAFIKKLQKQIEEYQRQNEYKSSLISISPSISSISNEIYTVETNSFALSDSVSSFQSETASLSPQLNDLDKAILKLEETVVRSKKSQPK